MASTYTVTRMVSGDSSGKKIDDKGLVTLTAKLGFQIVLDEGTTDDSASVEKNATDLPQRNDSHPSRPFMRVVDVNVTKKSVILYEASVSYESVKFNGEEEEDLPPIELAAEVEYSSVNSEEEIDEDADGNAIETAAGETIVGLKKTISDFSITIKKNFLTFSSASFKVFMNKVNSDTFLGNPPGTCKIDGIKATNAIKDDIPYWAVTVTVLVREPYKTTDEKAWYKRVLHRGVYQKIDGIDKGMPIPDGEGKDIREPVNLDADGVPLAPGATPHYLEFQVYEETAFASMGLF
jgi:hypothetical protein